MGVAIADPGSSATLGSVYDVGVKVCLSIVYTVVSVSHGRRGVARATSGASQEGRLSHNRQSIDAKGMGSIHGTPTRFWFVSCSIYPPTCSHGENSADCSSERSSVTSRGFLVMWVRLRCKVCPWRYIENSCLAPTCAYDL